MELTTLGLTRKEGETLIEFQYRVCESKDALDLTWQDVADIINDETGDNYGESKYSKWYKTFKEGLDYALENRADELSYKRLALKEVELKTERAKTQTFRTEINRWAREAGRQSLIAEEVSRAVKELPEITPPEVTEVETDQEKVVTVDLADMHFGREGEIKGLKGEVLSSYSEEIFVQRLEDLLSETVEILKKEKANKVIVFNLGDTIDGLLRLTQLQFLSMGVIDSVMKVSEYLAQWLNTLSEYATVDYYSVLGNHAEMRIGGIKSGEIKEENLEKIIPWFIEERLRDNKRVTVHAPEFIQVVDIMGTNVCITHGQNERNLENSIKDYMMIYGTPIHILKTGHLHHLNNKTIGMMNGKNIEYVQSPSICGIDDYSMKLKKTANAGSLITVFTPKGKYCTYEVVLD